MVVLGSFFSARRRLVAGFCAAWALTASVCGCGERTNVQLYVDGFAPERVSFDVEDLGALEHAAVEELSRRPDVDGALLLPSDACGGPPCRSAMVSIFVRNEGEAEPPPVVRLKTPPGRPHRQAIAFRGGEISTGRIGRIRWLVQLWPEETALSATLSSSVFIVDAPASPAASPVLPLSTSSAPSSPTPSKPQGD